MSRRSTLRYSTSEASSLESRTRIEHGFPKAEASLVSIGATKFSKVDKIRDVLSYFGSSNPLSTPITKDDVVWLLDNVAYRGPGGAWHAEFVSAAFSQKVSARLVDVVGDVADHVGLAKGDSEEAVIESRIVPFVMDVRPGRHVNVVVEGASKLTLGPGGRNGITSDIKKLSTSAKGGQVATIKAEVPQGTIGILESKTFFAEPEGWAVISDVDDTIKVTMTSDPTGILRSTFISEPKPVPGMPELYAYLQTLITRSAPWFYLSASPYNLYPFLRDFRNQHYPHGQLILRDSNLMTISGLLSNLTLGTEQYKIDRINKVHRWLPKRKLILIGDSTQSDPEAYGEIYRQHKKWVKLILIRKVTDIASVGTEDKNTPERFAKAFEDIPKDIWYVFEDASECQEILHRTVEGN